MEDKLINALTWIVNILEKNNIKYKISGGFAVNLHGGIRETADIDIDLSEKDIEKIYPLVKNYSIFDYGNYKDEQWDLNMITLNYNGQIIDLCGIENTKIFNVNTKNWEKLGADFTKIKYFDCKGLNIPASSKEELISYKSKILRDVDFEDIKFLKSLN